MATRLLLPRSQIVGADGRPVSGAKLNTYESGTSTAKAVYTDAALTIAHANPVVADTAGRFPAMFLAGGDYRTVLTDADDAVIWTDDPVSGAAADDGAATATASMRNRLDNSAFLIAQEFGTANTDYTATGGHPVDRWVVSLPGVGPGGTIRFAQTASVTPGGSPFRLRATVNSTDASIAAGDFYTVGQRIEGARIADARFGSASARQILVRLGVNSSIAGTFGVTLGNSAGNRSYVGTITVAPAEAGTDVTKTLTIPGDTSGTWLTSSGIGLYLRVCLAGGSTYQATAGWQAGNYLTTSAQTNWMGTGSATFDLFDCGVYVDASAAGDFPTWELPDFATELNRCMRYYQQAGMGMHGSMVSTTVASLNIVYPIQMRAAPTLTQIGTAADIRAAGTTATITGTAALVASTTRGAIVTFTRGAGTWTAGNAAEVADTDNIVAFEARL